MQPQEFMQRLAALVPRPRLHQIRFHGVLAPNATLRAAVIPQAAQKDRASAHEHTHGQVVPMRWARLLKRVFDIDVELRLRRSAEDPRCDRRACGDREDPHAPGPGRAGAATRSGAGVFARLRSLSGEQDDGSAAEPTAALGP
jgi:hypothetical protein